MLVVENGEIIEEYDEFINIGEKIPPKITRITDITNEMIENYGIDERDAAHDLKRVMTPGTVMLAHNAHFDLSFIYQLLRRNFPWREVDEIVENVKWIDTLTVLKDRKSYPHKLCDAVEYYKLDAVKYHRAIDDTKALYRVTQKLKYERDDLREYCNLFGYNPKYGVNGKFKFIRYLPQPYHNGGILPPERTLPKK